MVKFAIAEPKFFVKLLKLFLLFFTGLKILKIISVTHVLSKDPTLSSTMKTGTNIRFLFFR